MGRESYSADFGAGGSVTNTGGEYTEKMEIYARLGVLYYVIYNPRFGQRDKHQPFEVYKLTGGEYQLQESEPCWMEEMGLGIGRCVLPTDPFGREVLSWFDAGGQRYLTPEEQERQQGILIGEERGILIGEQRGIQQAALSIARNLLATGMDPQMIATATGLTLEQVQQLRPKG